MPRQDGDVQYDKPAQQEIIGSKHPAVRLALKIQRCKSDDEQGLLFIDGLWVHEKMQQTNAKILHFFFCPELFRGTSAADWVSHYRQKAANSYRISEKTARRLSDRDRPDGFFFIVAKPDFSIDRILRQPSCILLILDGLENPGNIGTILRSCDGAGIQAVLLVHPQARLTHPKLVKSSMGAIFKVPVAVHEDAAGLRQLLHDLGFTLYLADPSAAQTYREHRYAAKTALVLGSERFGLSSIWSQGAHQLLSIPMRGIGDSLNVAVAASILVYEIGLQEDASHD